MRTPADQNTRPEAVLAGQAGRRLREKGLTLAVAESCTGGALGDAITDVPGSSEYFLGGVIAYGNAAKGDLLAVPHDLLVQQGAVSPQVAVAMAEGARQLFRADIALATTGIAGPGGGTPAKPVGLVYIALAASGGSESCRYVWQASRRANKLASVQAALELLCAHLGS